jgi:MFS family permease
VIAGAIGFLQARFELTPLGEGFSAACALAGCAVGAGLAGVLSDRFGRKKVLVLSALAFFISALGTALPRNLAEFLVFRFIGGIGIGAASIISPMYIAEVTPFRIRGRMVSLNQFAIVSGIMLVYFVNYFITHYGSNYDKDAIAAHVAEHGATLDRQAVKEYLDKKTPEMVDRQIEQFLVEPRAVLDRRAVVEFLRSQGLTLEAADVAFDDRALSPTFVRDCLRDRLPGVNRRRIDELLATNQSLDSRAVAGFLDKAEIKVEPTEVSLAACGLTGWNVEYGWRWMFGSGVLPAVIFLALLLVVPESPRWLTENGRRDEALGILTRVDGPQFARDELRGIEEAIALEGKGVSGFREPWMRRTMALGIALAVLQQMTGINAILYYAPRIFAGLGVAADSAMMQTVVIGAVNVGFTIVAVAVVDRLGRRPLMMLGSMGMCVALIGLGAAFYMQLFQWWALLFILGYIACFAMSVGPVTWVILAEIFPTQIRGRAMGTATVCLWLANYLVSLTYPVMAKNPWLLVRFHQGFPFWVYAGFCVALVVVIVRWVPETKGKSLEEIERLQKQNSRA